MKLHVLSAMHFKPELFVKCGFLIDDISNNDHSAVKLSEGADDDWHSLQDLGVQHVQYMTVSRGLWGVEYRPGVRSAFGGDRGRTRRVRGSCRT
jgi:hypothetical protein